MAFITGNQSMHGLSILYKTSYTYTSFAMDGIVSKVDINALLLQTILY